MTSSHILANCMYKNPTLATTPKPTPAPLLLLAPSPLPVGLQPRARRGALTIAAWTTSPGMTASLLPFCADCLAWSVCGHPHESGPPRAARADHDGLQRVRTHAPFDAAVVLGPAADGSSPALPARTAADWVPAFFSPAAYWIPAFFSPATNRLPAVSRTATYGLRCGLAVRRPRRRTACPSSSPVIPERLVWPAAAPSVFFFCSYYIIVLVFCIWVSR